MALKKEGWAGLDDWSSYMSAKKAKLEEQFLEEAKKEFKDASSLFAGVAIFVNGYTSPCADELKRLMMAHGGVYHHYMRSAITTHIIASNLPYSKIVMYRKLQNPLPICKPEWITDSLKAKKLLDWRPYVLYSNSTKTQPQLKFSDKTSKSLLFAATEGSKEKFENDIRDDGDKEISDENPSTTRCTFKSDGKSSACQIKPTSGPLSTKNSEFLSEFYNNSRLHHISTMGTTFKDYVNELRTKNNGNFPGLSRLKKSDVPENSRSEISNDAESDEDFFENASAETRKSVSNERVIMHIDMDCFFVSVGLRNRPELKGFPVAVTHARGNKQIAKGPSNNSDEDEDFGSMSEIASCSYEARQAGVKNGMFLGQALKLCANLKTIKYDFDGYKEVSYTLYDTVASYTLNIEAVSCDEMYADITTIIGKTGLAPLEFATIIRDEIKRKTRCTVSTGFGCNKLQARLATRKAKPDGQFYLHSQRLQEYIGSMVVRDLPGVGYSTMQLLNKMNVRTCSDLHEISLVVLQKEFGKKTGEMLYNTCRGIDNSKLTVEHVRKSVSAEVNYGIRFENANEAEDFLRKLSEEVCARLQKANAKGRSVTLKLMVRAKDAPKETPKFMGHGICDNFTKSKNFIAPIDDPVIIIREVISLWIQMRQPCEDIRGIGIQISRLESSKQRSGGIMNFIGKSKKRHVEESYEGEKMLSVRDADSRVSSKSEKFVASKQETKDSKTRSLRAFLVPQSKLVSERNNIGKHGDKVLAKEMNIEKIDETVLAELPEDIRREILESRAGINDETQSRTSTKPEVMENKSDTSCRSNEENFNSSAPTSQLSQIANYDESVLKELPVDIRNEILAMKKKSTMERKKSTNFRQTQQENYFKHAKSSSGKCEKAKMPPIEEIDVSVLVELPEDIRNEIMNDYRARKGDETRKNDEDNDDNGRIAKNRNTESRSNDRTRDQSDSQAEANLSFSQVDPDFLAALSDDIKNDVEMYCMVKKREKLSKMKKSTLSNAALTDRKTNNRDSTKFNKKNVRLPKSKNKTTNVGTKGTSDRENIKESTEVTRKIERRVGIDESRNGGRFLDGEFAVDTKFAGSTEEREEIISHHSSFTGNKAKTEEQEMVTSLVNYLFALPLRQVKMQIQRWISNGDDVNEIDLLSLATFLSMLPKKKRLEELHILLKTMHRCIAKTGSCVWHETYRRTVYHAQRYMQIEYNSKMMLPTIKCDVRDCEKKKEEKQIFLIGGHGGNITEFNK